MSLPRRLTPGLLAVLGYLAAVGPFAVDLYLPSFTDISSDLNAPAATVQLTLTGFLIGIAAGQLVLGPASDRFGRRRVMLAALAVFAVASIGIALAPHIAVFIGLRVVQGFAGSAGMVISRAIVVDLSERGQAVRPLSLMMTVVGLGPIIAPPIGGLLAAAWGWRGALGAVAVLAVVMFVLAAVFVPESLPPERRATGGAASVVRTFGRLLRDRAYRGYLVAFALGFAAMLAYVSASPFVAQVALGMDPVGYSLMFAIAGAALILANLVNAWLAPRVHPTRMLAIGQGLALTAGIALVVLTLTGSLAVWSFVAGAFVLCAGTGLTMSNGTALALARTESARGGASALIGASQFVAGAAVSPLVGLWGEDTALPMALIITVCVGIGVFAAVRAGRPDSGALT